MAKKVNYSTEDLKNSFKYIMLAEDKMYAMKAEMPFNDNDIVYEFTLNEKYENEKNKWFRATELVECK